jgi:hypothetical protein
MLRYVVALLATLTLAGPAKAEPVQAGPTQVQHKRELPQKPPDHSDLAAAFAFEVRQKATARSESMSAVHRSNDESTFDQRWPQGETKTALDQI